jgi:hypothetical protein
VVKKIINKILQKLLLRKSIKSMENQDPFVYWADNEWKDEKIELPKIKKKDKK